MARDQTTFGAEEQNFHAAVTLTRGTYLGLAQPACPQPQFFAPIQPSTDDKEPKKFPPPTSIDKSVATGEQDNHQVSERTPKRKNDNCVLEKGNGRLQYSFSFWMHLNTAAAETPRHRDSSIDFDKRFSWLFVMVASNRPNGIDR